MVELAIEGPWSSCPSLLASSRGNKDSCHQGCHADVFGRTDGPTDDRTMAVGASVTWTHCSVLFEVTWGKTAASARTHGRVRAFGQRPGHGCQGTI
jgi:hypothetical protein